MTTASLPDPPAPRRREVLAAGLGLGALGLLAGCASAGARGTGDGPGELRLGYFANLTHGVPLLGVQRGTFARALGATTLTTQLFNAGPAATEALLSGALDAAYLGPSPAINAYARTAKKGVRLLAGGATGGAALVVKPALTSPERLRGATLGSPQLGGTQDVALRAWLLEHGLKTDRNGGSDVTIVAQDNAQTLDLFKSGTIDGAWLPEPWVSRLVVEAGARVLVDEAALWPGGLFPTTQLLVTQAYLAGHATAVASLLRAHVEVVLWARANPAAAAGTINGEIGRLTGKALPSPVLSRALGQVSLGWDPVAAALPTLGRNAVRAGTASREPALSGILDLRPLNAALAAAGQPGVDGAGLEIS